MTAIVEYERELVGAADRRARGHPRRDHPRHHRPGPRRGARADGVGLDRRRRAARRRRGARARGDLRLGRRLLRDRAHRAPRQGRRSAACCGSGSSTTTRRPRSTARSRRVERIAARLTRCRSSRATGSSRWWATRTTIGPNTVWALLVDPGDDAGRVDDLAVIVGTDRAPATGSRSTSTGSNEVILARGAGRFTLGDETSARWTMARSSSSRPASPHGFHNDGTEPLPIQAVFPTTRVWIRDARAQSGARDRRRPAPGAAPRTTSGPATSSSTPRDRHARRSGRGWRAGSTRPSCVGSSGCGSAIRSPRTGATSMA